MRGWLDNRYRIGEALGSGGMGVVHRGTDPDGRQVAIKRLRDDGNVVRFEIEARLLRRLDHPRVVRVVDYVESNTGHYLVMEWVDGKDLGRVLAEEGRPGLPQDRVVQLGLEASEALRYVHEQHVVHRDLKPQNLMFSPERGVVVVDFGVARDLAATGATREVGTPGFMAPEAFVGGPFSPRTDVFGLAATLWTLLEGRPPAWAQRHGPPAADEHLGAALVAALAPDPRDRLASIDEFVAALGGELGPERGRELSVSLPSPVRRLLRELVRTAAGVFDAAAASVALREPDDSLVYTAAWGTGSEEILGTKLQPGTGISGSVARSGRGEVVEDCRGDPRFASAVAVQTGYVPHTMLVVPLRQGDQTLGVINILDQRSGQHYDVGDLRRAELFADLAVAALAAEFDAPTL